jgi:hypothetical protein
MREALQCFIAGVFFVAGACTKKTEEPVEIKETVIEDVAQDIKIPQAAWDLLEFKTTPSGAVTNSHDQVFAAINVVLTEKNPGVLSEPSVRIKLQKGGGAIDLSRYVTGKNGTFFVKFEFAEFADAVQKRVLFVSKARKRKIGGEVFGEGCNKFLDITDKYFHKMSEDGLTVNTTQQRYLSILGGHFLFSAKKDNMIAISQVSFYHSQHPNLMCEEP